VSDPLLTRRRFLAGVGSFALTAGAFSTVSPAHAANELAETLDTLLARYVVADSDGVNRIAYGTWKEAASDRAALVMTIESAAGTRPSGLSPYAAFAYWTNLYNALTLQLILDHYPVRSIREIKSSGCERTHKAVTGKRLRPRGISDFACEHGVLQRHEHADAAGRGIDGACKRDHQKQRVVMDQSKGHTRGDHQAGGGQQELAVIVSGAKDADADRQERGTKQRRGCDDADMKGREAKRKQISRQQNGHEAVTHVTQGTRQEKKGRRVDLHVVCPPDLSSARPAPPASLDMA
jgi:hypothetical protein